MKVAMNENKKIAINSVVIFARLCITSVIGIFTSRIVLDALGASDYGLYNVVGGIVTLLNVVNTAMLSTTYRYIAFEVGKKKDGNTNKIFNVSLLIHAIFSIFILVVGLIVGTWYVNNYLNIPIEKISDAHFVLRVSLITSAISTLLVPYQGLLVAYEKFTVNAVIDVVSCVLRLVVLLLFIYTPENRLHLYSLIMMGYTVLVATMYVCYSVRKFYDTIKLHLYKDFVLIKDMMSFALWTLFGAVASIGKTQGSALLINFFYGTLVNAAYAVANQIESFILMFARSLNNAAIPQITKNFSGGNKERSILLTSYISKYTFLLMCFAAFPVLLEMDFLLDLWLKDVPVGANIFCNLMVLGGLIGCLGEGIPALVNATGNIKTYQIIFHTFNLLGLPIAYIFFKNGYDAYIILVIYCIVYLLGAILRLFLLKYLYKFDIRLLINKSYIRILLVSIPLIIYYIFLNNPNTSVIGHLANMFLAEVYLGAIILLVGLDKLEKQKIKFFFQSKLKK